MLTTRGHRHCDFSTQSSFMKETSWRRAWSSKENDYLLNIVHEMYCCEGACLMWMFWYCSKPELARLRLQAGCCMLKLAEYKCYGDLITREQFQALALLMNVSPFKLCVGNVAASWLAIIFHKSVYSFTIICTLAMFVSSSYSVKCFIHLGKWHDPKCSCIA